MAPLAYGCSRGDQHVPPNSIAHQEPEGSNHNAQKLKIEPDRDGRMAVATARRMAPDLRNAASMDADRRETRLKLAPFWNHWWHCTLYVTPRGLTTSAMPYRSGIIELEFDFLNDALSARTSRGEVTSMRLQNESVADFYERYRALLASLGVDVEINGVPNELPDATPFAEDVAHATYDAEAARRCWRALVQADRLLNRFRGQFSGKCSPSHFWWGSFDLACTRFSGRTAPPHPGGIPNLPLYVVREAYSRECISAGWWPGAPGSSVAEPAFYAYA